MTRPATVVKNSDGTYSVRIQHDDAAGTYTEVHFPNMVFGETLANAYAAFLNGEAKLREVGKEALPDLKTEAEKVLEAARKEASRLETAAEQAYDKAVKDAKYEAARLKTDAEGILANAKIEAEKLIAAAKAEIEKLRITKTVVTPEPAQPVGQGAQPPATQPAAAAPAPAKPENEDF
jgi:flagellar biosynthesis/type III secretory pathway protein FliH